MTRKPPSPSQPSQPSPSKPAPNVATMQPKLRAETIKLLGLDASKLDAGDEIMIARCGALRLMVADLEAAALHGDKLTSISGYVEASAELERLIRGVGHVAVAADGGPQALRAAREKMAHVLGVFLDETPDEAEQRRLDELAGLHKRIGSAACGAVGKCSVGYKRARGRSSFACNSTAAINKRRADTRARVFARRHGRARWHL